MWVLDPANSPDLIHQLRPHGRGGDFEVAWVGEGWRVLVSECHAQLRLQFPEYELLAIKQKDGVLEYQAFPRPWVKGEKRWSEKEAFALDAITDSYRERSETVCEWCGGVGRFRGSRKLVLTLCDECDDRFPDPPYKHKTVTDST